VRAAVLDHGIPCLAFALEEKAHVNVWKTRLAEMGLPSGPWLGELKRAALRGEPADSPFRVWWREGAVLREQVVPLGALTERLLTVSVGQRITYVVDAAPHEANARRIVELAHGSAVLFIETPFLEADADVAATRHHLTAKHAGRLAREAGVDRLVTFHFSPRYLGLEARLEQEAQEAFASAADASARGGSRRRRPMMALLAVGEEVNHRVGDAQCPECWEEYPEPCTCGGLVHAAGGPEEDEDGNVVLTTLCDQCGRSEEQLDVETELGQGAP